MPLTRTLTSMGLSGLAKLSFTPAQHTGMLVVLSSVGGAVMFGGARSPGEKNGFNKCYKTTYYLQ